MNEFNPEQVFDNKSSVGEGVEVTPSIDFDPEQVFDSSKNISGKTNIKRTYPPYSSKLFQGGEVKSKPTKQLVPVTKYVNGYPIQLMEEGKATEAMTTKPIISPEEPSMRAATQAEVTHVMEGPRSKPTGKFTGSKGEQLLTTFMSEAADKLQQSLTFGLAPSIRPSKQGISGETGLGIAGRLAGSIPEIVAIGKGFQLATGAILKNLPSGIATITDAAIKLGFTTDMLTNALKESSEFASAYSSGDQNRMIDAGTGILLDLTFATLIGKGLKGDAAKIADYKKLRDSAVAGGIDPKDIRNEFTAIPSKELNIEADKTAYEPEVKQEMASVNKKIVRSKIKRTPQLTAEEFEEILGPVKEDLAKLKDWSDYPKGKGEEVELELTAEEVPLDFDTDIDLRTGTKTPDSLSTEESPFRVTKESSDAQAENYAKSPIVAQDLNELRNQTPEEFKSALVTTHKLVNDFNQYLDGKSVDIEKSKTMINDIAANAEDYKWQFVDEDGSFDEIGFNEFRQYVSDASKWMSATISKGDIVKVEEGFSLYSNPFDPTLYNKLFKYESDVKAAKNKEVKDAYARLPQRLRAMWLNQSGNARKQLEAMAAKAYDALQATTLARGGSARAAAEFEQYEKSVKGGLSSGEKRAVDRLILSMTVEDISKGPKGDKVRYPENYTPAEAKEYIARIGEKSVNGYKDLSPTEELVVRKSAEGYFNFVKKIVDDAYDGGLIGKTEQEALKSRNYSRMTRVGVPTIADLSDVKRYKPGTKKDYVWDSGVESMKQGGGEGLFEINSDLKMLELANRFYTRIMNNKAKKSMAKFGLSSPGNDVVFVENPKIIELEKQPNTVTELMRSIRIKRVENKISDFEFADMLKTNFKVNRLKDLKGRITDLKILDMKLGEVSKGYEKVKSEIPKGWKRDTYYEDGIEKSMYLEPKFASEWMTDNKEITSRSAKLISTLFGTNIVKMFATGINPVFALRNFPRDIMHAWFAARVMQGGKWEGLYNNWMPVAVAQFGSDFKDVFKDVAKMEGRVQEYLEDGGGLDFLYKQGSIHGLERGREVRLKNQFDRIYDTMSVFNNRSELITRLMIRERVIKKRARERGISVEKARKDKAIRQEATFAAVDQMNFGEKGYTTKVLDNIVPYLGASVTGTRSLFRTFEPNSGTATSNSIKLAQFGALITGLYILNRSRNKQAMEDLKDDARVKNSLPIVLGKDAGVVVDGQTRYPYFRVALDPSQVFFKTLIESLAAKAYGDEVDVPKVMGTLKELLPANTSGNPLLQGLAAYALNKDLWNFEDVYKGYEGPRPYQGPTALTGKDSSNLEVLEDTGVENRLYNKIGQVTGLSPTRLKALTEAYLTRDEFFSTITFSAYDGILNAMDDSERKQTYQEMIAVNPVAKSVFGLTNPLRKDITEAKEINEERINARLKQDVELDKLLSKVRNNDYGEVYEYVYNLPNKEDRERVKEDIKFYQETKELPNRSWWMMLKRMDVRGRAEAYAKRYRKLESNPEAFDAFMEESMKFGEGKSQIKGVITPEFNSILSSILAEGE